ncbi:MAG: formylglycine-generating enzyme family protein [Candidatus Cloacimonadia bacterium]
MKDYLIIVLLLIAVGSLTALELKVESFEYDPFDLTNMHGDFVKDYNGEKCAVLRVETNVIPDLFITGQEIFEKRKLAPSEYYFFLSYRSYMISFSAKGYAPLQYQIPLNMRPGLAYKVVLKSIGVDPANEVNIMIVSEPSDAEKWLDGELLGVDKGFLVQPGKYKLEVKKQGYSTYTQEIEVSKENFIFEGIKLQPIEEVLVTIKSQPSNAEVYINGVRRGVTDAQYYLYPGKYQLRLILSGYFPLEEEVEVKERGKNEFSFSLNRNSSIIQFRTTPSDAKVYISREEVRDKRIELAGGTYSLEVKREGYDDYRETITVIAGKDETHTINLTQQTGTVTFEVNPMNAKVILSRGNQRVQEWIGTKRISDLAVGDYIFTVSMSGYKSTEQKFTVKKDERLTKSVYLEEGSDVSQNFVLVEGGSFQMGSNDGRDNEKPIHTVTINSFFINKYELTQKEWIEVMGSNPSNWKGDNLPVERVSWYNVIDYCNKRSVKEGLTPCYSISGNTKPSNWSSGTIVCNWNANGYRLPTEAEWEYAARGGKKSKSYKYSGSNNLGDVGWYRDNSGSKTHPVGEKKPNELGIYDMSGNVYEWCWDWYNGSYYSNSPQSNPKGPESGSYRVIRGGSYYSYDDNCTVSIRNFYSPSYINFYLGVRLVRVFP